MDMTLGIILTDGIQRFREEWNESSAYKLKIYARYTFIQQGTDKSRLF